MQVAACCHEHRRTHGRRVVRVEAEGSADGGNGVERDGMLKFAHGV